MYRYLQRIFAFTLALVILIVPVAQAASEKLPVTSPSKEYIQQLNDALRKATTIKEVQDIMNNFYSEYGFGPDCGIENDTDAVMPLSYSSEFMPLVQNALGGTVYYNRTGTVNTFYDLFYTRTVYLDETNARGFITALLVYTHDMVEIDQRGVPFHQNR